VLVERRERRRRWQRVLLHARNSQLLRQVHQTPAAVPNDPRRVLQSPNERSDKRREVHVRLDGLDEDIRDPTESPSSGVFDMDVGVLHHLDQRRQRLSNEPSEHLGVRPVEDRAEGHDGSLSLVPALGSLVLDVRLDKGDDALDYVVPSGLGEEREGGSGGHRDVPLVLVGIFFLVGEELEEDGENLGEGGFGKVLGVAVGELVEFSGLGKGERGKMSI
jgi:hypothetical protein